MNPEDRCKALEERVRELEEKLAAIERGRKGEISPVRGQPEQLWVCDDNGSLDQAYDRPFTQLDIDPDFQG